MTDVQVQLNKALQLEYRLVLVEFFPLLEDLRTRLCRISHLLNLAIQVLDQRDQKFFISLFSAMVLTAHTET